MTVLHPLPSAVDLFCGMGGATTGLQQAGLRVEAAYDSHPQEVAVHCALHPGVPCEVRDVASVTPGELAGRFVWASPPCPPWSLANSRGLRGPAHPAYYPLARLIEQARDAVVLVVENVAGLVWSVEGKRELALAAAAAERAGRAFQVAVLRAAEYGVPQWRSRAIIVVGAPLVLWSRATVTVTPVNAVVDESRGRAGWHRRAVIAGESVAHWQSRGGRRYEGRPLAECARLQGVPVPPGVSRTAAHRMVGNAVPPAFAAGIAQQVLDALRWSSREAAGRVIDSPNKEAPV